MVPESAKDPLLIPHFAGAWGELSRTACRVGKQLRPALPIPVLLPHSPTFIVFTTLLKDQRPQVSSLRSSPTWCCKPILVVSVVTASSPWLHTNCHGHAVALPTASAVSHMRVCAIISPTQAWGVMSHGERRQNTSLLQCVSSPQSSPLPSTVPCLEPEGMISGDPRPEQQHRGERKLRGLSSHSDRASSQ